MSKQDIQSVFASAKKISRKFLLALFIPNELSHPRLGIIIGKQHVKRAVDRNRLRRVVRESFRTQKQTLNCFDIIVLVKSPSFMRADKKDTNKAVRDEIEILWRELSTKV